MSGRNIICQAGQRAHSLRQEEDRRTGGTWWKSATEGQRDHRSYFDPALKEVWVRGNGAEQEFSKTWMLEIFRFQDQFGLKIICGKQCLKVRVWINVKSQAYWLIPVNPTTWNVAARGSIVQTHSMFEATPGFMTCLQRWKKVWFHVVTPCPQWTVLLANILRCAGLISKAGESPWGCTLVVGLVRITVWCDCSQISACICLHLYLVVTEGGTKAGREGD